MAWKFNPFTGALDFSGTDLGDTEPAALGVAAAGVAAAASRSDHVHEMPSAADVGANLVELVIAASDETTDLTAGTDKVRFRMPFAMTLTAVKASVNTAPTGSTLIVDINEGGVSILGDKLSIDASATTSVGATTPATITDSALADNAVISVDVDQIGATIAGAGLKVTLIGTRA
jgi:hypothetical protein